MSADTQKQAKVFHPGLVRRLMAVVYDSILVIAILFLATITAIIINGGEAIDSSHPYYGVFVLYLFAISFFYYCWFWTQSGQTLGMKTWKIGIRDSRNQQRPSWRQASIRALTGLIAYGIFGLGLVWSLLDKDKRAWHDMASHTELIDLRYNSTNAPDQHRG